MIGNSAYRSEVIDLRDKSSRLSASLSPKLSLSNYNSMSSSLLRRKGYSFGSSSRQSLMQINLHSPAPKYHIQGLVEINLHSKRGAIFGSSREGSVERTPLSYLSSNQHPGPGTYHSDILQQSGSSVRIGRRKNDNVAVQFLNEKAISKNPGPAAYHPKLVRLKGGKLTVQSKRFQNSNKENRPGPGTYNSENLDSVSKGSKHLSLRP